MQKFSFKSLFLILVFILIPIIFLFRINQKGKDVYAEWFNDNWSYRQAINISAHTVGETSVYISNSVNIGTTTKAQADDGDFRFTTQSGQLLDYYISSGAGTTAPIFHVLIDSYPSGAQTIYAYYGNPSASNGFSASDFATAASNSTIGSLSTEETGGGPIAWWKFDEGVGTTAFDSTQNGNNAVLSGSTLPTWTSENQCISGKCLSFNGISGGITAGTSPTLNMTDQFTTESWIYWYSHKNYGSFFGKPVTGQAANTNYMFFGYSNQITLFIGNSATTNSTSVTVASGYIDTNRWHHVVGRVTDTKIEIWIDGVRRSQANRTISPKTNTNAMNLVSSSYVPDAKFDDMKLYNYARTDAQIKQDYTSGLAGQSSAQGGNVNIGGSGNATGVALTIGSSGTDYCVPGDTASCANPVAEWKFEEGVGTTAYDTSGNGNDLSWIGGSNYYTTGKYGKSANFNADRRLQLTDTSKLDFGTGSFSLNAWMNFGNANSVMPIAKGTSGYTTPGFQLFGNATAIYFYVGDGTNYIQPGATSFSNYRNRWAYYTFNYDSSTHTESIYINSVFQTSATNVAIGSIGNTLPFTLGSRSTGGYNFQGQIDQVRIYNYARTQAQIAYDYNQGAPIGWWKLDECEGNVAHDSADPPAGGGNTGSINIGTSGTQNSLGTCQVGTSAAWTSGASGKINSSLNFDGVDDKVIVPLFNTQTTNITMSVWVYWKGTSEVKSIIYNGNSGTNGYGLLIGNGLCGVGNKVNVLLGGRACDTVSSSYVLPSNQWVHLVLTRDATTWKLFANGQFKHSGSTNPIIPTSGFGIGNDGNSTGSFNGQIDDVRVYNYALTSTQIKTLYNGGAVNFR